MQPNMVRERETNKPHLLENEEKNGTNSSQQQIKL